MNVTEVEIRCHECKGTMYVWSFSGQATRCVRCRDGTIRAFSERQVAALLAHGKTGVEILPGPDPAHPERGATIEAKVKA